MQNSISSGCAAIAKTFLDSRITDRHDEDSDTHKPPMQFLLPRRSQRKTGANSEINCEKVFDPGLDACHAACHVRCRCGEEGLAGSRGAVAGYAGTDRLRAMVSLGVHGRESSAWTRHGASQ